MGNPSGQTLALIVLPLRAPKLSDGVVAVGRIRFCRLLSRSIEIKSDKPNLKLYAQI